MTSRQRLRSCYSYEPLDRPGVYSRTGFPKNDSTYDKLKAYLQENADLKRQWRVMDFFTPHELKHHTEPYSDDFDRHVTRLPTPAGELVSTTLISCKGQPGMVEKYFLTSPEDAEKYLSLPIPEPSFDASSFFAADTEVSQRDMVQVLLPANPGGKVASLFGSEAFGLISITDRHIVHALCEREMNVALRIVKHLLSLGAGPCFALAGEERICPPLHGPKDFADFNVRYDKPIIDLIHEAGGKVHMHCHGSVKKVFPYFVEMGVDVLHPFEAPPMGDITAAEAKELARGRMCLEGNIQIGDMYERTPDEIAAQTRALIADAFDDKCGLIVSPTASPYIRGAGEKCFGNYKAMIDTVVGWTG